MRHQRVIFQPANILSCFDVAKILCKLTTAKVAGFCCIQDTFALVYKIPYRRARAWPSGFVQPLGRVRARAKESCIQPLLARALGLKAEQSR